MQNRDFFSTFQTLFFVTGMPFAVVLWFMLPFEWHQTIVISIVAGIVLGLPLSYWVRTAEFSFARGESSDLMLHVSAQLADMGYRREDSLGNVIVFRPTLRAGLLADRIVITQNSMEVIVCGPRRHVEKLSRILGV